MDIPLSQLKTETAGGSIPFSGSILAVGSVAALVIVKKMKKIKKPAAADDAEKGSADEECSIDER